jgi:anti-sigma-K factor RskA
VRYDDPATRQALAAEYVLGTLRGAARRRFERLMVQRPEWRDEVQLWSTRLAGMAARVSPVEPPATLWPRIQARLGRRSPKASATMRWWQVVAVLASIAAMALGVALWRAPEPASAATQIAILRDAQARTAWVITLLADRSGTMQLRVVAEAAPAEPAKSFELWALPPNAAPVSLGLLPSEGARSLPLTPRTRELLGRAAGLAVSLEPAGGSPTGQPTGPVLYQGKLAPI